MIRCAALKIEKSGKEIVVPGLRHCDIIEMLRELGVMDYVELKDEGFLDHNGNYLTIKEAWTHAENCGQLSVSQIKGWRPIVGELFSEYLY